MTTKQQLWIERISLGLSVLTAGVLAFHGQAEAAVGGGGGGLPWESTISTIRQSITGPVAAGVAALGCAGAGGALIFGNAEMNEFAKRGLHLALATGTLVLANNGLSILFPAAAVLW